MGYSVLQYTDYIRDIWLIFKIMIPFWDPYSNKAGYSKRDHNFDKHPYKRLCRGQEQHPKLEARTVAPFGGALPRPSARASSSLGLEPIPIKSF